MAIRIGVALAGDPRDPSAWSGTPRGLVEGLTDSGVEVVPVRAALPSPIHRLALRAAAAARVKWPLTDGLAAAVRARRNVAVVAPEIVALRNLAVRVSLRRAGHLDGLVQVGTEYEIPPGVRTVTFEDRTVPQAAASPYSSLYRLPPEAIEAWSARQRRAYHRAVACCMTSSWGVESVVREYGIPRSKVHAVGVGRNHSPPPADRDWTTPRFLFVGKEWERKNGPTVLRCFASLRAELPLATLDVVGQHPRIDVEGVTAHGPLRLSVPRERERVERLFQKATCFVMPSHQEPSALAYVEAAAAGIPSIGTTEGGSGDIIGDGGLLVAPRDEAALLAAMRTLSDPTTAARLGALGRRRSSLFTWRLVAERILRALAPPGVRVEALAPFL